MKREQVARRLREARLRAGLTEVELSRKTRIPLRTISAYEHGEILPGLWALATLCMALGISPGWVLDAEPGATDERPTT
jgi:transcriptional regulator with XRE-family HTH domain